jgi:hypothetical protein
MGSSGAMLVASPPSESRDRLWVGVLLEPAYNFGQDAIRDQELLSPPLCG